LGLRCEGCGNRCKIAEGEAGFCGLVKVKGNKLVRLAGSPEKGLCEWYHDQLPTNCVASWICPGGTGCGYPKFAVKDGPEYGYYNLSVFYGACNFDCLFCQNWHFRNNLKRLSPLISSKELASKVNKKTTCICFFGGNPDPQLPHAIKTSQLALERKRDGILRACIETNGNANPSLLKRFAEIAFRSGGSIKIDFKCMSEALSYALCGISNKMTLKNLRSLANFHRERPEVPFLHVSTLLVPGYLSIDEIRSITTFIAELDRRIPFSLLAFYPTFMMRDLPLTSKKFANKCYEVAKGAGLKNVRIGNVHLLR
jgi:pyruvate formate lyase activating enzyme